MSYTQKIIELRSQLSPEHQDIAHYVQHVFQVLEKVENDHRKLTAAYALNGSKISGPEEKIFYDTIGQLRLYLIETLERTVEDFAHKGDKHWVKNFSDGVD